MNNNQREPKGNVDFHKYEKYGAYHWNDIEKESFKNKLTFSLPLWTRYQKIISHLPPSAKTAIDIGCGDGALTYLIRNSGTDLVTGCDTNELGISLANKKVASFNLSDSLNYKCQSFEECGFEPHSFDAVIMSDVIEHLPEPNKLLIEIKRTGKPGGLLIMTTPRKRDSGMWDKTHFVEFTESTLNELVTPYFPDTKIYPFTPLIIYQLYRCSKFSKSIFNLLSLIGLNPLAFFIPGLKHGMLLSISRFQHTTH